MQARIDHDARLELPDTFLADAAARVWNVGTPVEPDQVDGPIAREQLLDLALHFCREGRLMRGDFRGRVLGGAWLEVRTDRRKFGIFLGSATVDEIHVVAIEVP